jgi:hypothetical protein
VRESHSKEFRRTPFQALLTFAKRTEDLENLRVLTLLILESDAEKCCTIVTVEGAARNTSVGVGPPL